MKVIQQGIKPKEFWEGCWMHNACRTIITLDPQDVSKKQNEAPYQYHRYDDQRDGLSEWVVGKCPVCNKDVQLDKIACPTPARLRIHEATQAASAEAHYDK